MKKLLSIAVALAVALSMLIAVPATAAQEGTVSVVVTEPVAGEETDWMIKFNAAKVYAEGDTIDITFPTGVTITAGHYADIGTGATQTIAKSAPGLAAVNATVVGVYDQTVRLEIDAGEGYIAKYAPVIVNFTGIVNPSSCFYTVQVQAVTSAEFPIYSLKIELLPGKNLISLPAYPEDTAIEVVLADLFTKFEAEKATAAPFDFSVWYWDAWEEDWVMYAADTSFDDLATMEAGKAYWVKVNKGVEFYFKGDPYPECQGPPQKWCFPASWNMIGITGSDDMWASQFLKNATLPWPSHTSYAVSSIFEFVPTTTLIPEGSFADTGWFPGPITDAEWQQEDDPGVSVFQDVELTPGVGYFMSFLAEACIIPPVHG